jgi:tRNA threonylcarbamoyladenosine biosynthesis protein TsaE
MGECLPAELVIVSGSRERTLQIGAGIGASLLRGDVLCLEGDLGTGKTVIVQGLAGALGYGGNVPSPTFTIINPYPEIGLCHVDAFRLDSPGDLIDAGIEEYLEGDWICAVEWAERVRRALPERALEARIAFGFAEDERVIRLAIAGGWNGRTFNLVEGLKSNA